MSQRRTSIDASAVSGVVQGVGLPGSRGDLLALKALGHDVLQGVLMTVRQLESGRAEVRAVPVASAFNELAVASRIGVTSDETASPVQPAVKSACEVLGLEPLYVASEGALVAVVAAAEIDREQLPRIR
jgi:hydrogenase expression/formation protein HypE